MTPKLSSLTKVAERNEGKLCDDSLEIPEPKILEAGQDIYFELLNIQPAQIDLSLLRTDVVNVEDKTTSNNPTGFPRKSADPKILWTW